MKQTNAFSQRFPNSHLKIAELRLLDAGFDDICRDYEEVLLLVEQTEAAERSTDQGLRNDLQSTMSALEEEIKKGLKCSNWLNVQK